MVATLQTTSILSITTPPFKHTTHNLAFLHAQREWLQLGTTAFPDLRADSMLGTITRSVSLAQGEEVDVVVVYGVLFNQDGKVAVLRDGDGKGKERTRSLVCATDSAVAGIGAGGRDVGVPSAVFEVQQGDEKSKLKLKEATMTSLGLQGGGDASKLGVIGKEDSMHLIKAILPVIEGSMMAVVMRVDVSKIDTADAGRRVEWVDRADVEAMDEGVDWPAGLKGLLLEAFEQREFERIVVVSE